MNWIQKLLWKLRIERSIGGVERLADQHPDDLLYRIDTAQDALSIFEESSSQSERLLQTSEAEGEEIEVLFLKRWKATHPGCVDETSPYADQL